MPNMSSTRCPMPSQDPAVRSKNFDEVALGYTYEMAVEEAKRCLHCKHKPCVSGCPVGIHIPAFVEKVAAGEIEEAYQIIHQASSLPAVCGRVCPQESQCEGKCVRGIKGESVGIGRLERSGRLAPGTQHGNACRSCAKRKENRCDWQRPLRAYLCRGACKNGICGDGI